MNLAWKEMKRNKIRFLTVGSIIFLVSFLTFIISGLADGLSYDNASVIKNLPDGEFYIAEGAESYNMSRLDADIQETLLEAGDDAFALSIQLGFVNDEADQQQSVAFVASTETDLLPDVEEGEVLLDRSLADEGIKVGDTLTSSQFSGGFTVAGFVDSEKFSHAPVAFVSIGDFREMYRTEDMQAVFVPGGGTEEFPGLQSLSKSEFLGSIPSYSAEQNSLTMIVGFLIIISGMLYAIFFYMMNIQKIGLYGILKAIGLKTSRPFRLIWMQMLVITASALCMSVAGSQLFARIAPEGMPFRLDMDSTLQLSAAFVIIGFAGATLSGIQIKKVQPLHAIQQGEN